MNETVKENFLKIAYKFLGVFFKFWNDLDFPQNKSLNKMLKVVENVKIIG